MKRKLKFIMAVALMAVLVLGGCGGEQKNAQEESADNNFLEDFAKGLEARWDLSEADEKKEGYDEILVNSQEYHDMMINYIDAELQTIEKYQNEKFEDSQLQEIAIKYINLLKQHKECCDYMTVDYDRYLTEYEPIYNERSKIIKELVEDYGLTVDDKYQDILNEFLVNSKLVEETEDKESAVKSLVDSIQFQMVNDDGYGYKTYQAIVENTTDIDFETFSVNINLLNGEGVIVESFYDSVTNFGKGVKAQLEFSTDKEFASTQVVADWWE